MSSEDPDQPVHSRSLIRIFIELYMDSHDCKVLDKKIRENSRECHNHKPQPFQEEEETNKTKQAQIEQTYEKQ